MPFSMHLNPKEKRLATRYARFHGISVAEAFKRALFEQIEDEYDAKIAEELYTEYLKNPKTYTHREAGELLGTT